MAHTHDAGTLRGGMRDSVGAGSSVNAVSAIETGSFKQNIAGNTGSAGTGINNMNPFAVVDYIIKV